LRQLFLLLVAGILTFTACVNNRQQKVQKGLLESGKYELAFAVDSVFVPIELNIDAEGRWTIVNWTERIQLDSMQWTDSTFLAKLPFYNTTLSGRVVNATSFEGSWTDHTRAEHYEIPVKGLKKDLPDYPKNSQPEKLMFDVLFSPNDPPAHDLAIGMFYRYDTLLYGTFLTRSGDHRFLQGRFNEVDSTMMLSAFDGAHLFHYTATLHGDSIYGDFFSGKHYRTDWNGHRNALAKLNHPDSIIGLIDPTAEFRFKVRNENGDSVLFDREALKGKVTVVQVAGSWCSNCMDETRFFKELYEDYGNQGLQFIPVHFERAEDFEEARKLVKRQHEELHLPFPSYFGGPAGKGYASKVFSNLEKITAYPTAIFIDKKGDVRKIHSGFYGPSTGDYYHIYATELESFVQLLLSEPPE
jgi:thiol-disulfide isomerase/thioredoxin